MFCEIQEEFVQIPRKQCGMNESLVSSRLSATCALFHCSKLWPSIGTWDKMDRNVFHHERGTTPSRNPQELDFLVNRRVAFQYCISCKRQGRCRPREDLRDNDSFRLDVQSHMLQ